MKLFDAIIFDIDGTLTYTNDLIFESFRHITRKFLNKPISDEEIIALFGPTEEDIINDWFGHEAPEVIEEYYRFYTGNHQIAGLYPGMREILASLSKKSVPLGIFTGKGRRAAEITLAQTGVSEHFQMLVSGTDVVSHKPHPEGILKLLDHFKTPKERTLIIGDAPGDIHAARGAGIKVASGVWDSYAKEEVIRLQSDYLFHTVDELGAFLEEHA